MKKFIYIALSVLFLTACGGTKKTTNRTSEIKETQRDSTYTLKEFKAVDTLVTVPKDSIRLSVKLADLTEVPIERSNGRTTARVSYKNDRIEVDCLTEEYEMIITLQKEIITTLREIIKEKETNTSSDIKEEKIPWYLQTTTWIIAALIYGALNIGVKLFKR